MPTIYPHTLLNITVNIDRFLFITQFRENTPMMNDEPLSIGRQFLQSAIKRFEEYKELGDKTFLQVPDDGFHWQPNETANSIAIIIQHLHGNMLSRWTHFLREDGEKPWRRRDAEFEPQSFSKAHLIDRWNEGWTVFFGTLHSLTEDDLQKEITIRGQALPVIDAINRQMAHYCGHVGQIVYIGKLLQGARWQTLSIPKGGSQQFNKSLNKRV